MTPKKPSKRRELTIAKEYHRFEVANALGVSFSRGGPWATGVVALDGLVLLFVTLDKSRHPADHQYRDAFEDDTTFRWQSQNRESHKGTGRRYTDHLRSGTEVLLFVRETKMLGNTARRFFYLGPIDYVRSEGDLPMTVWWKLRESLHPSLRSRFGLEVFLTDEEWNGLSDFSALSDEPIPLQVEKEVESRIERGDYSTPDTWGFQRLRAGQRAFRRRVLANFNKSCAICGLDDERLLDAAHIVSWKDDPANRLNPQNGIALCVLHHRAFDTHIIRIDQHGLIDVDDAVSNLGIFANSAFASFRGKKLRRPRSPVHHFLSARSGKPTSRANSSRSA